MVKRLTLSVMAVLLLSADLLSAGLIVDAGSWNLQPNTTGQQILVSISGTGNVTNATVIEEILGVSPLPSFTDGNIVDGTIFASNNTGAASYDFTSPQIGYLDVGTNSGTVIGNGILAKLTVSTLGVTSGDFVLNLLGASWGDTSVGADTDVTYNAGSIHIVPEPGVFVLLIGFVATLPAMVRWRYRNGMAR